MKKVVSMIVVIALYLSLLPPALAVEGATGSFSDLPTAHWAYEDVMSGVQKGYINGLPDGTFAPNRSVSRSEFIKMVVAALELPIEELKPGEAWYAPYTNVALEHGLIDQNEYADGNFAKVMTRMEMVRVAVKAIDETARTADKLNDELLLHAVENGIIRGIDGKLVPEGLSSRSQAVTVIERMLTVRSGGELPIDESALKVANIEYKMATGDIWEEAFGVRVNSLEVARYIEMQVHESFKVENGHLKGFLPELPDGLEYGLSFRVYYDPADKVTATNMDFLNYDVDLKPGESFSLPIPHEDKIQRMMFHVSVIVTENGSKRRYSNMEYYSNREITEHVKY